MPSFGSVVATFVAGSVLVVGGGAVYGAIKGEPGPDRAVVVKVVDGDTLDVRYDGAERRVRLLNVDTPETKHPGKAVECLGPEATSYLEKMLEPGDEVRLEFDVELLDRYGRELAGVFEGDVLVNAEIARHGLGVPVLYEPNRKFYDEVVEAYEEAKGAGQGMFSADLTCTFEARTEAYAEHVAALEAQLPTDEPEQVKEAADQLVSDGAVLLAIVDASDPGSLAAAGLTAAELADLRAEVVGLKARAEAVSSQATADIEQIAKEKARAEREAKQEAERKAREAAEKKAQEEAERKAAEEAERLAAEEAERQAEAERRAAEEAERQAEQSQIQPLMPQPPAQPAPQPAPVDVHYKNCAAARAAGAAPVYAGQPGYAPHLDRDGDGVGCE